MPTLPNLLDGSETPAAAVYLTKLDLMWLCHMVEPTEAQLALPANPDYLRMRAYAEALHGRLRAALLASFDLGISDTET